jgi:hypothetical protein
MPQNTTSVPTPSDLLAAAAAIAAGTQAYGEVIIFINPPEGEPGHFDWILDSDEFNPNIWLDITRPSTDQGDGLGPRSIGQHDYGFGSTGHWFYNVNHNPAGGALVAVGGDYLYPHTASLSAGTTVDGLLTFLDAGFKVHASYWEGPYYGWLQSHFAAGEVAYMGVRFSDLDGYHYGWIGVIRNIDSLAFDAFAWGYETEPGVPIVAGIPAPGTLAALAFGAAVTRRGRKRKDS